MRVSSSSVAVLVCCLQLTSSATNNNIVQGFAVPMTSTVHSNSITGSSATATSTITLPRPSTTALQQASLKASSTADAFENSNNSLTNMRGGESAASALQFAAKALPMLAAFSALGIALTAFLAPLTSPAAQGTKLVFAGAVAGIISRTFCAPIEMVSTVMMCRGDECSSMTVELMNTWKAEGFKGMFKGNGANCLKVAPSRGTQFLVYEFMKRQFVLLGWAAGASGSLNAGSRLLAGGIAGMVAASIVYPLEVVKTMLTLYPEECNSIGGAVRRVWNNGGIPALYRGLGPTLVAMFPYVGVEFMVYETLKKHWEFSVGPMGTGALLLIGAIGGAAAQASAHPLDVIRRRMQMQSMFGDKKVDGKDKPVKKYSNMFTGLYRVSKDEGWHALFNGLGPACLEKIPSTAIGYFIYEAMKVALKVTSV